MDFWNNDEGINKIVKFLQNINVVPIFGSGFTFGNKAFNGLVPNSLTAVDLMKKIIKKELNESISSNDFHKVSSIFINNISSENKRTFFKDYFTRVKISDSQKDFLKLPWMHAYTINIDDAIENNSDFEVIYPYHNLSNWNKEGKYLYKLHGDANYELNYTDDNIVFCTEQYLNSLQAENNKSMLNNLLHDYVEHNLLFIGCSLHNEIDIAQIYKMTENNISGQAARIILRKKEPNFEEKAELMKYGINTIILVNDYNLFYEDIVRKYKNDLSFERAREYKFFNPKVKKIQKKDKLNIEYFSTKNKIFDGNNNEFIKHSFLIERDNLNEIDKAFTSNSVVIIQGRRFSGKTSIITSIIEKYKKYDIYFFPTETFQEEKTIDFLFNSKKESLFLFDSNSIDKFAYKYVSNSIDLLKKNNNKLILFINSNDNYLADSLDAKYIKISNYFTNNEIQKLNVVTNLHGIINRKEKDSNIDYLKKLFDSGAIEYNPFEKIPEKFSNQERVIIILLCAVDKIYSKEIHILNILNGDIYKLLKKLEGIIECVPTTKDERRLKKSNDKYVYNSKYLLMRLISKFTVDEIIESIVYIVKKFKNTDSERLYIEVILFDTLNQLFSENEGSTKIIFKIYDALHDILNDSMDYWLQRSKSIYRRNYRDINDLEKAYKYAYKAYADGGDRLKSKSALTLSLICCLIANCKSNVSIENSKNSSDYERKAILFGYEAIKSDFYKNKDKLKNAIDVEKRRGYRNLILDICNNCNNVYDLEYRDKIMEIRRVFNE